MWIKRFAVYCIVSILALVWLFPFAAFVVSLVKSPDEFDVLEFWALPSLKHIPRNLIENIAYAWSRANIGNNFFNSFIYASAAGVGSAFVASLAGYALVHLSIRAPQAWFLGIFAGNLFPFQMFLIPLYVFLTTLNLYDTRLGLTLVYLGICVPFALFVYRNYAFTIPRELFDAAKIDGASPFDSYIHIFLPLSKAAFAVVFVFQFTWTWNDLLFGLVLSENYRPVMTALSKLSGLRAAVPVPVLNAGALIASVPTILTMLLLQRFFIRGFTVQIEK